MADRIELTGLECFGYHGVFAEEKRTGQPFIVDIICWSEFAEAAAHDDLTMTINYAELANIAADIVEGPSRDLIETVASEVADTIMASFADLHAVEVTVHKPKAPIPRTFGDVAVIARRSRKHAQISVPRPASRPASRSASQAGTGQTAAQGIDAPPAGTNPGPQ
ncbi:dihydroneopterin aldolase [Corynebacterium macginleyi]|uniref:7,8-dihydroneopterin aldolase n=1 Tax=Corynebacterium macginleyi TaxID=38290 RepID=A0A3M0GDR5_9CORY|nr:dihydroneopterin aldolase [Corynebacterium macginleyi]RMB62607.1 dihydroneopterin aldolase [Corynebacterium macginleyi]